jgi:hypothetical protein
MKKQAKPKRGGNKRSASKPVAKRSAKQPKADKARARTSARKPAMPRKPRISPEVQRMFEARRRALFTPEAIAEMAAVKQAVFRRADELGGRVAFAAPAPVWRAIAATDARGMGIDIVEAFVLRDGSGVVLTSGIGEDDEENLATCVAELLDREKLDRSSLAALPFFRENLIVELRDASDLAVAIARLGTRARLLPVRTMDELDELEGLTRPS